jgi:hypothetical protein
MRSRLASLFVTAMILAGPMTACSSGDDDAPPPPPCVTDPTEPNETASAATQLGEIHDDDVIGTAPETSPTKVDRTFSTHDGPDVDWFVVDVRDTGINGNPSLRVLVGAGHEATAFWSCTEGTTKAVACGLGTPVAGDPDLATERGCRSAVGSAGPPQLTMTIECDGTSSDNGRLRIRVKKLAPATACERYRLTVSAE